MALHRDGHRRPRDAHIRSSRYVFAPMDVWTLGLSNSHYCERSLSLVDRDRTNPYGSVGSNEHHNRDWPGCVLAACSPPMCSADALVAVGSIAPDRAFGKGP